jgi:hypothetical protein
MFKNLFSRRGPRASHSNPKPHHRTRSMRIESLEDRKMMSASPSASWFQSMPDRYLAGVAENYYEHGGINRQDMITLLETAAAQAQQTHGLTSAQWTTLQSVISNWSALGTPYYVADLAAKAVDGDPANSEWGGNLFVGASASQVSVLTNVWFYGSDLPAIPQRQTYEYASGPLFSSYGPLYSDVNQGTIGDCYFLSALAETAYKDPNAIRNMIASNGDGTYTVRFFINGQADYVTVDSMLPVFDSNGGLSMDGGILYGYTPANAPDIWVELVEKAYAQENASGKLDLQGPGQNGQDSYASIGEGGYGVQTLAQITGNQAYGYSPVSSPNETVSATTAVEAFEQGYLITAGTNPNGDLTNGIVGSHAYAMLNYNATTQMVTLYNPWGMGVDVDGTYIDGTENGYYTRGIVTIPLSTFAADYVVNGEPGSWIGLGAAASHGNTASAISVAASSKTATVPSLQSALSAATDDLNAAATESAANTAQPTKNVSQTIPPFASSTLSPGRQAALDHVLADWDGDADWLASLQGVNPFHALGMAM